MTKLTHGIDLGAPGGLAALFDLHRARYGDLRMVAGAEDPKNSRLVELRTRLQEIDPEILRLAELDRSLSDEEEARWDELTAERDVVHPELAKLEARAERVADIQSRTYRQINGLPVAKKRADDWFGKDVRQMPVAEARDGALTILADKDSSHVLRSTQLDQIERELRKANQTDLARRIIVTENDHYRSAFHKLMTRSTAFLTGDEQLAMLRYEEYRAQSEGTTTAGGFAIPVFIDPSVILTDQETDNPFLTIARQVQITTNAWKGVSAAGVSWSFDAEGSAVSDDSITLAQPSVTAFMARGFIPYSIEVGEDWPGFQAEMARLLGAGYDELLINKMTNGNGTTEPRGLLTALAANASAQVVSTTDGVFGSDDVYKVWKALPQKYRRNASWMSSVDVENKIRQFSNGNNLGNFTVDLRAAEANVLMNKPWYENAYFPDFTGTTGVENRLVVGDFSNYVVAQRRGMNIEFVPQLFDVTNNRPTGQRGWFATARIGGNSVNDLGFRLLQNQ
jgi:HK97 family phage major capsid protein